MSPHQVPPCGSDRRAEIPHRLPPWVPWAAFFVGLTGAISLRLILVAKAYRPDLIRLFWYIGVCGNMLFFLFRTYITQRRRRLVERLKLLELLRQRRPLCQEEYEALHYLVASLYVSKERWNYFIIFFFSLLAIGWDLFLNR